MTFSLVYAWSERFILPLSHDEVVHGKGSLIARMPGDRWQQLAGLRAYFGFMWSHPGKKLLFMGSEFAQSNEWNAGSSLDWWLTDFKEHQAMARFVQVLNQTYQTHPALWQRDTEPGGFEWLVSDDADANVFAWVRHAEDGSMIASISNLSPVHRSNYHVPLPRIGTWKEVLNSDALDYGGSGEGNLGQISAEAHPLHSRPASATLNLGPLATLWFSFDPN